MAFGDFEIGHVYNRRSDIHAPYQGQQQGGIATPTGHPVIFLFTGESGETHGYSDGWIDDVFRYFGEGQIGDMPWVRGNAAIRDHAANGKDLLLFKTIRKGGELRYLGQFACAGFEIQDAPDRAGNTRKAIVFNLVGLDSSQESLLTTVALGRVDIDLMSLRERAIRASKMTPESTPKAAVRNFVQRSADVRAYVLARACGKCEGCARNAPFETEAGRPYLEPHHIRRLSDGGPDDPRYVAALCPNCHRHAHFGRDRVEMNRSLLDRVTASEAAIDPDGLRGSISSESSGD